MKMFICSRTFWYLRRSHMPDICIYVQVTVDVNDNLIKKNHERSYLIKRIQLSVMTSGEVVPWRTPAPENFIFPVISLLYCTQIYILAPPSKNFRIFPQIIIRKLYKFEVNKQTFGWVFILGKLVTAAPVYIFNSYIHFIAMSSFTRSKLLHCSLACRRVFK